MIKVKIVWDAQFCGRLEETIDVPDETTVDDIAEMFPKYLGVEFDKNCEIIFI